MIPREALSEHTAPAQSADPTTPPSTSNEQPVSPARYNELKRKYFATKTQKQDAEAALAKAQELVAKLRAERK